MAAVAEDGVCACQTGRIGWSEMDPSRARFPQADGEKGKTTDYTCKSPAGWSH